MGSSPTGVEQLHSHTSLGAAFTFTSALNNHGYRLDR
jgi:hypothetical protein